MLSKGARLSKHQVEYVLSHGKRISSRYFLATFCFACGPASDEKNLTMSRWAAIISKKVAPTAVQRNSARRRMYNAIRANLTSLSRPACVAVVAKKESTQAQYSELVADMKSLLASVR